MDSPSYLSFNSGITHDRVFAHRGDIFVCTGVFKELDQIDKDDHILGKPSRPVLIISEDEYNMLIDLEKKLLINDGDSDIEINILNVGQFDENNQEYPWEDLVDAEHRAKLVYEENDYF